jgi:hypothetical protein
VKPDPSEETKKPTKDIGSDNSTKITQATSKATMSTNNINTISFFDRTKTEGIDAAYRVGAKQSTNMVKAALVQTMRAKGMDDGKLGALVELFDSELGHAIISASMGLAGPQIPMLSENDKAQRLFKELRIGGMETLGNMLAEVVTAALMPILTEQLAKLPAVEAIATEKVRVNHEHDNSAELAEAELEAAEATKLKQAAA